jgi:membrane-bound lytic murein transglycosylase MltF
MRYFHFSVSVSSKTRKASESNKMQKPAGSLQVRPNQDVTEVRERFAVLLMTIQPYAIGNSSWIHVRHASGNWITTSPRLCQYTHMRIARTLCLTLNLLIFGCSKRSEPEPASKSSATQPEPGSVHTEAELVETLAPVLRTPWKGDLDAIARRRVVRVLLPFRRPEFFYMDGRPAGILQETFQELERILNTKYKTTAANHIMVALLPTPIDKLRDSLLAGYGDIAAYGISITEQNKQVVDFTMPTLRGLKMVVVTGPGAMELNSIEDLSGKEIWVERQTRMKSDIDALNIRLKAQGRSPVVMRGADSLLDPADIMEMVNAGIYPIALMQSKTAEFWAQVFDAVKPRMDLVVAEDVELGWAIQKGTPQLKAFLDQFIQTQSAGAALGSPVMRKYLKEAKYVKNARDAAETKKFRAAAPVFRKYAERYRFDALLLLAQGYQESELAAKSNVGAIEIIPGTPGTAGAVPGKMANIQTAHANIHASVRMVHFLVNDYFNERGLDQFNRTMLAIAAYNAGPAKIARCRQHAKEMGYDPNKWFGNVEVATAKLVGREATQYVANIYKYYVAYRMALHMRDKRGKAQKSQLVYY